MSQPFGLARGFDAFGGELSAVAARAEGNPQAEFDVVRGLRAWGRQRDPDRPFFVSGNPFGIHDPYEPQPEHLFLPPGVDLESARRVRTGAPYRGIAEVVGICDRRSPRRTRSSGRFTGSWRRRQPRVGS